MMISGSPAANAAVANRSKVVMSPQEQQAAYDEWLRQAQAETERLQGYANNYATAQDAYNQYLKAVASAGGAEAGYESPYWNLKSADNPGGGGLNPNMTDYVNGKAVSRADMMRASDAARALRLHAEQGKPLPVLGNPNNTGDGLQADAARDDPNVAKWQNAYLEAMKGLPQVDPMGNPIGGNYSTPLPTHQMGFGDIQPTLDRLAQMRASGTQGVNSWNQFIQDYSNNQNRNGQAYLDMLGGGYVGGINPWATNPSWSGTGTPQWQSPQFANNSQLRSEAMQSPWGQAGAPFQQQAWAGGILGQNLFTPNMTNPFQQGPTTGLGMAQEAFQQQQNAQNTQAAQWYSGMFDPNTSYNPQLASNAPWGGPFQNNAANGGSAPWFAPPAANPGNMNKPASQNPMTFGQSPWGSW